MRPFSRKPERRNPETYLSFGGRFDFRVTGVADDVVHFDQRPSGHTGEGGLAVIGEVTINLPRLPVVHGALDHHGSWPKRL